MNRPRPCHQAVRATLMCLVRGHQLADTPWLLASTGVTDPWVRPGRGLLCFRCNVVVRVSS